jgi:hypothetical protein
MVGTASVEDVQDREETLPHADITGLIPDRVINVQNIKHVHCLLPSYLH